MVFTEFLKLPYDDYTLSDEEIQKIEDLAYRLYNTLEAECNILGLTITDYIITKFTEEELSAMPTIESTFTEASFKKGPTNDF